MSNENFMKDISLDTREKRKIDKKVIIKPDIKSKEIIDQFNKNIENIRKKFDIYSTLTEKDLKEEAEDILRSQVVFLMSALDFYMHEIAKYGLLKIFNGEKPKTSSFKNFLVSIETVQLALKNPESVDWLSEEIILRHSHETFMSDTKIKKVLAQISTKPVYTDVAPIVCKDTKELNEKLNNLYARRNKIAHQSDREHGSINLNSINKDEVKNYIDLVDKFINEVHKILINDV